jgi:hypothetical protein
MSWIYRVKSTILVPLQEMRCCGTTMFPVSLVSQCNPQSQTGRALLVIQKLLKSFDRRGFGQLISDLLHR